MYNSIALRSREGLKKTTIITKDALAADTSILTKSSSSAPQGRSQARTSTISDLKLSAFNDLPEWRRDNEYVLSGYRPATGSLSGSFHGLGCLHNDTVNIYTHLIGGVIFTILPFLIYYHDSEISRSAKTGDLIVFSTFFLGVAICFFVSANFHVLTGHSPNVTAFAVQLDFLGIIILMWGSTVPTVYYGFACDPGLQVAYIMLVTVISAGCVFTALDPRFRHPTRKSYRALLFMGLGFSAMIFMFHGLFKYGWELQRKRMSLDWMILMATFNMIGAVAYAARIPERWYPYKYDMFGSSHQIFHSMVVLAAFAHMFGLLRAFHYVRVQDMSCALV